jgi:hypothetical protein
LDVVLSLHLGELAGEALLLVFVLVHLRVGSVISVREGGKGRGDIIWSRYIRFKDLRRGRKSYKKNTPGGVGIGVVTYSI